VKTSKNESLKIMIVAAEASSSAYAEHLLQLWNASGIPFEAFGIGSREMEAKGFEILGRSEELAVVGLGEIIAHWKDIKKAWDNLVKAAEERRPDFILLMDYPEFNMRLARRMKDLGIPVVYYISPQIWAWRTYRVHKIKKLVDLMLVIFPFEEEFYKKHGVPVKFVGHPLLDLLSTLLPEEAKLKQRRSELLKEKKNILGLMPGSRKSEIKFNLETQIETAKRVVTAKPEVLPVLFVAPSLNLESIKEQARVLGFQGELIQEDPFFMISLADEILCASGTATLMVGLCKKPMVIMYKMKPLTAFLAKYLVKHIPFFGMVNLVLKKEAVPERFQEKANPEELGRLLLEIIDNKSELRARIDHDLARLRTELGAGGGIRQLSESLLAFREERS
jgi:lipid-A-disaccharide synthase